MWNELLFFRKIIGQTAEQPHYPCYWASEFFPFSRQIKQSPATWLVNSIYFLFQDLSLNKKHRVSEKAMWYLYEPKKELRHRVLVQESGRSQQNYGSQSSPHPSAVPAVRDAPCRCACAEERPGVGRSRAADLTAPRRGAESPGGAAPPRLWQGRSPSAAGPIRALREGRRGHGRSDIAFLGPFF